VTRVTSKDTLFIAHRGLCAKLVYGKWLVTVVGKNNATCITPTWILLSISILRLWFRAPLIYINNCPARCNTKQSICYSASSLYMFRDSTTPIIRSAQNCNYSLRYCAATSLQRGQAWPRWREAAAQKIWPVPEAVVTVLCTPDDRCDWHPKHVEWICRIVKRLLCVASRWTIVNIYKHK